MPTIADYELWKAKQQQNNVAAAQVVLSATDATPDEVAGDLNLANEFGKATGNPVPPLPLVKEHRNVFQAAIERHRNSTILSSSPRLTEWLRNPENAAVARDDLEGLSWWETALGAGQNALSRGIQSFPQSYRQWLAAGTRQRGRDQERSFAEIYADERSRPLFDWGPLGNSGLIDTAIGPISDAALAGSRYLMSRLSGLVAGTPEEHEARAAEYQRQAAEIAKRIDAIPMSPAGERGKALVRSFKPTGNVAEDFTQFFSLVSQDLAGFVAFLTETAVESAPAIAAATAGTLATRSPGVGATILGLSSGTREAGSAPFEFFREHGLDVSTPEGALEAIQSEEMWRDAMQRGMTRGVIIGIMDGLSGGIAGQQLAKSPLANLLLQSIVQAGLGAGGEAAGQIASGQEFNLAEVLIEGLAEFVTAPIEVAGVGGRAFVDNQRKARDAEARRTLFQELSGQAVSSKLRARMPDKFREFVEAATKDGPVEHVYVPANEFVTYFQGIGVDPWVLVDEELDGVTREDLEAALAGGGDLQIPTATYAAKIAGSEHDAFLMENMRFDPDQMTAREAAEFNARAQEAMEEAWQVAEELRRQEEEFRSFEQEIYDTMVSRLRAAGRSTEVATTEAMLYPAFYRVMAERSNLTIEEFLQRYPLPQVQGAIPQGFQFRDVDELNRTLAEARNRKTVRDSRMTLLEFIDDRGGINDVGGELRARDAETIRRGRGKKTLRLARPGYVKGQASMLGVGETDIHSADSVAQAAIEYGYMADDPIVIQYKTALERGDQVPDITRALWDAIDRELAGEPQYSIYDPVDPAIAENEALDEIEQYLSSLGLSLDDDDDTIKAAIRGDQSARRYGQFAGVRARTLDSEALERARAMEAAGELPGDIYEKSGFFKGPDGLWRFEISDADAKLKMGLLDRIIRKVSPKYVPLGSILDHPKLFEAYPQLATYRTSVQIDPDKPLFGSQDGTNRIIEARGRTPEEALSVILHEVAHAIQTEEGFARGGNPSMGELYEGERVDELKASIRQLGEAAEAAYEAGDKDRLKWIADKVAQEKEKMVKAARFEYYRRLAGEVEARNVQARDKLRRAGEEPDAPWWTADVTSDKVIVVRSRSRGDAFKALSSPSPIDDIAARARPHDGEELVFVDAAKVDALWAEDASFYIPPDSDSGKYGNVKSWLPSGSGEFMAPQLGITSDTIGFTDGRHRFAVMRDLGLRAIPVSMDPQSIVNARARGLLIEQQADQASNAPDWMQEILEGSRRRKALAADLAAAGEAVRLQHSDGRSALAGPDMSSPGGFRLTRFDNDGPVGHTEHSSLAEAIEEGLRAGYRPVGRSYDQSGVDSAVEDQLAKSRAQGLPLMQDTGEAGRRGSIQFPAGGVGRGDTVIRLFQGADLSTMLHESGHYFLSVMQDLAANGEEQATADLSAIRAWWRSNADSVAKDAMRAASDVTITADDVIAVLDYGTTGDADKDIAIDTGMHEQWARAFEAYLMEGKAPSAELRSAFEKFRAWLISVYRRLVGLNVAVSDDIRAVMDRMLATDEEIAKAQAEAGGTAPLFATAEEMGLSPEEFSAFLKLRSQAEDEAKARLLREIMAPIKREREKWYKEERAKVRKEVEREVNAYPYYRAIEWLGNRRWLGDDPPLDDTPDLRLSKAILVERYGEGVLKTLPRGKQTIYTVDGGLDPDDAAGWFGFDSGDEMIRALERAPKRIDAIEAETDRIMYERHGDVLNDGTIEAEALDAVHTDKRGQWIAAELKAVIEVAGTGEMMTAKAARETARRTIARMRVRDAMNANRFLAAERKAGEEAARLGAMLAREKLWMDAARRRIATKARAVLREDGKPDAVAGQIDRANRSTQNYNETVEKLVQAKRRQLLNHALYMEARKVADEVGKAERFVAKLSKKTTREKIAGAGRRENAQVDYLAAIDELLDRYDFRRLSGAAERRRGALNAFVEAMKAAGRENELAIPEAVLADAARKPYKTLPVEELRGVIDSLKNLEHVALRWDKLIDAQQQRALDDVVADIVEAFDANLPKRPPGRVPTSGEALRNAGRQFLDLVLNAGTILREIDGFADFGPAYRNIKSPIDEAMNRLIVRKQKAAADLEKLYSVYSKEERRRMSVREYMPALGYSLSKWERIAVALNTGNAGNLQRLTDPKVRGSLTEAQVAAVLATLDERDADFVQSVWDYIGSFRADIAARERRTTGVEPEWVEAQPVQIAGKTLRGGYYPLKYDPRLSSLARDDQTQEIAQSLQAGRFGKAQTRNGHLKDRKQSSGRDVELDMSVLHRHVNQVIYDLELSEPVANSWRILQDGRVRSAFIEAGKQADFDALETWLKDVAEGELRSADFTNWAARTLKSNFTAAKLAFNLSTVMVQVAGLSQSMVVVGKKDFVRGVMASFRPGVLSDIVAKSPFMASRQTTFNKDIYDFYTDPKTGPVASRWGDIKSNIIGPLSFWLMTKVQWALVDVPTWLAGYTQGLRRFGNDEAKAIAHADAIVKRAQASGLFSDRSAVERGSVTRTARQNDVVRLFTALGSYMFAKFNVAYERSARASRAIRQEGVSLKSAQEALSWTLDMAFLFTLEAVILAAIKGGLPDDDDEANDSWAKFLAKETAFGVMGTLPFVRDVAGPVQGYDGGGAYGAITEELGAPLVQLGQGEVDAALVKSVINATGLATGLPATQINRAVDAAWREAEGEDVSPVEYILGRSKK